MRPPAAAVFVLLLSCYPANAPYAPASVPSSFTLPQDKWVYLEGASNAQDDAEKAMVLQGVELANAVLVSDCFKNGLSEAPVTHARDRASADVYASMLEMPPMQLQILLYDGGSAHGTVGWETQANPGTIHMNRYFVKTAFMVADNLLHEAAHVRGYIHVSPREHRSVPYTMNYVFEKCAVAANTANEPPLELSDSETGD